MYPGPNVPRHGKSRTVSPISRGYLWLKVPLISHRIGGFNSFETRHSKVHRPPFKGMNTKPILKPPSSFKTYQLHSTTTLLAGGNWTSLSIKEFIFNQSIPHQLRWDNDPIHLSTSGWQQDMVWKLGLGCWCFKKTCEATLVVLQNFHSHVWLDANSSSKCCAPCDPLQLPTGVICEAS